MAAGTWLFVAHVLASVVMFGYWSVLLWRRDVSDARYRTVAIGLMALFGLVKGATFVVPSGWYRVVLPVLATVHFAAVASFASYFIRFSRFDQRFPRRAPAFAIALVTAAGVLFATNPSGLFYTGLSTGLGGGPLPAHGLGYWAALVVLVTFLYVSVAATLAQVLSTGYVGRLTTIGLVAAFASVPVSIVVTDLFAAPVFGIDPGALVGQLLAVTIIAAMAAGELLETEPVSRDVILDATDDALIVERSGRLSDFNDTAAPFLAASNPLYRPIEDALVPEVAALFDGSQPNDDPTVTLDGRVLDPSIVRREALDMTVLTLRDVTELKEREATLRRENERLDRFVGTVAHDLRNPLAVAQGYLPAAREDDDALDRATGAVDRMDRMIDDLLALARGGERVKEVESVDIGEVARSAWESAGTTAPKASLSVETEANVAADRDRLVQLFENLFRNAVEHGGEEVSVRVGELSEADGDGFYVADDGPGFPDENVFEEGYTTADDGTGFGLSIVSEIAEAHGWTVAATDSSTGGARVEIARHAEIPDGSLPSEPPAPTPA